MHNQNGVPATGRQAIFFILCIAFFAVVCGAGSAVAADNVVKLKYSSCYMPFEPPNIQANHCLDLVEQKTNGKVKIERFMGGALGGPGEQLGLCSTGAVDIIALHTDQFTQQLPLHQILNTEQFVSGAQGLANITALTQEIPETKTMFEQEQEKNDIKVLSWHVQGVTGLNLGFEAKNLADLKGKKINVITGFQRKVFKDFGWIPVNVQIPELYEALSRGVIDGIFMATAAVIPLKWFEITKCHLKLGENTVLSQAITLNLNTWKKLPEDVQPGLYRGFPRDGPSGRSAVTCTWWVKPIKNLNPPMCPSMIFPMMSTLNFSPCFQNTPPTSIWPTPESRRWKTKRKRFSNILS